MSNANPLPAASQVLQKTIAAYSMRAQGPEPFYSYAFAPLTTTVLPKNIPMVRPLERIQIRWKGRIVIGTANYALVAPEAPQTILQRITLRGTHQKYGSIVLWDMPGDTLFALGKVYNVRGNSVFINNTRYDVVGNPSGLAGSVFGNTGTYDVTILYNLPTAPFNAKDSQAIGYLLDPADWGQTLQLQIQTGDLSAFGTPGGGTTVTFSAFGSGSGSPSIDVLTGYASLGPIKYSFTKAVVIRNRQVMNSVLANASNAVRLLLLQNQRTTIIAQKTGTQLAGTSAGVVVYGTLSDTVVDQTILRVDNKPVRNLQFNDVTKEFYGLRYATQQPQGYLGLSFIDGPPGASQTLCAFPGDTLPGGAQFDIAANVVNPSGTTIGEVVQEEIYGAPTPTGS